MAIQKVTNHLIYGLSSDTKPTNYPANTLFVETDTGRFSRYTGSAWLYLTVTYGSTATYVIYKSGSTYYADTGAGLTATTTSNTSFSALLQALINGISPAGTPTVFEFAAGDYLINAVISIPASAVGNITLRGAGMGKTRFLFASGLNGLSAGTTIITIGSNLTIAAGNTGTLTANTALGARTATMSSLDGAKFAQNDMVLLKSDTVFVSPATTSSISKKGEIKQVFSAPASGVVTFDQPAFDAYTTAGSAKLYKLTMLKNIEIEGITFQKDSSLTNNSINFVDFYYCFNLRVVRCELIDSVYNYVSGLSLYSCVNASFIDCNLIQNPSNTYNLQYGISFNACCQNCVVTNITAIGRWRHTLELANGVGGTLIDSLAGVTRNCVISNCVDIGSEVAAFDTHADGEFIIFENCRALGTYSTYGIMIRSKDTKVINCSLHSTSTRGIYALENAHYCELVNNTVYNAGWYGVEIADGIDHVKIRGGYIRNSADTGITIGANSDYLEVFGVTIQSNAGYGIAVADCDNIKLNMNTFLGNTSGGISITSPTRTLANVQVWGNDFSGQSGTAVSTSDPIIIDGTSAVPELKNFKLNASNNTIIDTSAALGDLFYYNGTKFVRFARGSTNQVLQATATTIQWATFNAENTGIATASGNGSTTVFNIAHSLGSTPSVFTANLMSHNISTTLSADSTNIVVTAASAPPSGTNNVKIYWRAIA